MTMSAKETADAILRDFRTSMADTAFYQFKTRDEAREVCYAMDKPEWILAEITLDSIMLYVNDTKERELTL